MTQYSPLSAASGPVSQNSDTTNYTLGLTFSVTQSGCSLVGMRFWSATALPGSDHATRLYLVVGETLVTGASIAFPSPLASGWNTATLPTPVALTSGTVYRACVYFTTDNGFTGTQNYFSSGPGASGLTAGPISVPNTAGVGDGNQCAYVDNADGFPWHSFASTNYWIDPIVDDGSSGSTAIAGRPQPYKSRRRAANW